MLRHKNLLAVALAVLLTLCSLAVRATPTTEQPDSNTSTSESNNFNCPEDCNCVIPPHHITPHNKSFLHAKCSSLKGLKSKEPLKATLPIHSIDLSFLSLPRLSHSLEKLHDLTSIDLSHNELHEIGHLGRRIKKLNLKHNRITSSKLTKLPQHVQVLNLQHNDITYLPLEFTKLTHLQTLELSHNTINCSCETLEVRNWLQERHVFMEHPVVCTYPVEYKGKSWLQLKQSEICEKEKRGWFADEEENELMLGDQPVVGSGDNDEEEELGKAFMPIDKSSTPKSSEVKLDDVEGSGDLSEMNMELGLSPTTVEPPVFASRSQEHATTDVPADEEEDGSGSGGGILYIPQLARGPVVTDDFETPASQETHDDDFDNKPIEKPVATVSPAIFGHGIGIYDGGDADAEHPVDEETIVPVVQHHVEADNLPDDDVVTDGPLDGDTESESEAIMHAKVGDQDDSNATYFLLGVIVLIVVGLILFVGMKRCKTNRRAAQDAESARQTELQDMDKKNLGKPVHRNGHEHSPLIGEKSKADLAKPFNGAGKKPYDNNDIKDGPAQQQPLLNGASNGNGAPADTDAPQINEPNNDQTAHEYYPITPRYPTPKSPRASKYAQHPQQGEPNNNNADETYLPSSPKLGRYSPVYSPETGRVKIKLTETPRPKTPMLVTRSKSNAGDIITTPVHAPAVAVHTGTANGHVDH